MGAGGSIGYDSELPVFICHGCDVRFTTDSPIIFGFGAWLFASHPCARSTAGPLPLLNLPCSFRAHGM